MVGPNPPGLNNSSAWELCKIASVTDSPLSTLASHQRMDALFLLQKINILSDVSFGCLAPHVLFTLACTQYQRPNDILSSHAHVQNHSAADCRRSSRSKQVPKCSHQSIQFEVRVSRSKPRATSLNKPCNCKEGRISNLAHVCITRVLPRRSIAHFVQTG